MRLHRECDEALEALNKANALASDLKRRIAAVKMSMTAQAKIERVFMVTTPGREVAVSLRNKGNGFKVDLIPGEVVQGLAWTKNDE